MPRSSTIAARLDSRARVRKPAAVLIILLFGAYLGWRLTIFSGDFGFSLAFYLSESLAFLLGGVSILSAWSYRHRESIPPRTGHKVDVFIPVYREDADMVRTTLLAARDISYPHETWLLDDGKRDELRDLADELGVHYLCREGNTGAKAGNINHALQFAKGDVFYIFDADHIAQREAIDAIQGFFEDESIGMVVTPQDYYNKDALQYMHHGKGRVWHDQSRFYNIVQSSKDTHGSATSCGTGVAYRRSAVEQIGGVPELTVTEDMHISLLIHKAGFQSVYFNESIAYGVAPADLADYYRTRHRWAHGNLHVLHAERPWKCKELTWKQRFSYTELGLIYLECWQQLLMILIPVISVLTTWHPFEITVFNVAVVLGFPLVMTVLQDEQGCGMNRNWTSQLFAIARIPVQMIAWAGFFGRKIGWRVSHKNVGGHFRWRLVAPQLAILGVSLFGLAFALWKLPSVEAFGPVTGLLHDWWVQLFPTRGFADEYAVEQDLHRVLDRGYSFDLIFISGIWLTYNVGRSGYWIYDTHRRTSQTHEHYRFPIPLLAEMDTRLHETAWISETHLRVKQPDHGWRMNDKSSIFLHLPNGRIAIDITITTVDETGYEARFTCSSSADHDTLKFTLYSVDWHAEMTEREGYFPTLLERFTRWITLRRKPPLPDWQPALWLDGDRERYVCISHNSLLGFDDLPTAPLRLRTPAGELTATPGEREEMQGWCTTTLNDQTRWKLSLLRE